MPPSIRVLVVDDSAFMRHTLTKHLESASGVTVIGRATDGIDALTKIKDLKPDVVTLDVEMPNLDGLDALRRIMVECPTPVIMLSAYTQQGAQATIRALMRGAVDFVAKPSSSAELPGVIDDLIAKLQIAANTPVTGRHYVGRQGQPNLLKSKPRQLRKNDPLIVMGASTGGPRAIQQVLGDLPADLRAAVAVVQHMPTGFTHALAQRLNESVSITVQEAANGDRLARGLALLAPGNYHLKLDNRQVVLDQGPRRNGVRPSLDVAMESAAAHYKESVIGVVLTGMGSDGTAGARRIKEAGGKVIAEHQDSSVVHGMPGSVIDAGLADFVVSLPEVAPTLIKLVKES